MQHRYWKDTWSIIADSSVSLLGGLPAGEVGLWNKQTNKQVNPLMVKLQVATGYRDTHWARGKDAHSLNFDFSWDADGVNTLQLHSVFVLQQVGAIHSHLNTHENNTSLDTSLTCIEQLNSAVLTLLWHLIGRLVSHLELVLEDEDDELEVDLEPEGHLVVDLFAAPALFRQRVAHDGRLFDPRVEMERYVGPRLHAAAAGEVHLEPVRQRTEREDPALRICTPTLTFVFFLNIRLMMKIGILTCQHQTAQSPWSEPSHLARTHPGSSQQRESTVDRTPQTWGGSDDHREHLETPERRD